MDAIDSHNKATLKYLKKLRTSRIDNHLCTRCGKPLDGGYTRCTACRNHVSELARLRRAKKRKSIRRTKRSITNPPLYNWMIGHNISITELAHGIGMSYQSVEKWLFFGQYPSERSLRRLEEYMSQRERYEVQI
jgi:hypothetical protein